jgi:hypothetical protein
MNRELTNEELNAISIWRSREETMSTPSYMLRPRVVKDGNAWLAIYGDLATGVVGNGTTPAKAFLAFDYAWEGIRPTKCMKCELMSVYRGRCMECYATEAK